MKTTAKWKAHPVIGKWRYIIFAVMLLFIIWEMSFPATGGKWHKWLGYILILFAVIHSWENLNWYKTLFTGKYNLKRQAMLIINLVMLLSFVVLNVVVLIDHQWMYALGLTKRAIFMLHQKVSYVFFIFCSLHIGLHYRMIKGRLKQYFGLFRYSFIGKNLKRLYFMGAVLGIYGLYYLPFGEVFMRPWQAHMVIFRLPLWHSTLVYLSVVCLFMVIGNYLFYRKAD